ncbi:hypothetical protein CPB83DRAFT_948682 [Crepidotus variabilis]|uniref:NACHT domain-containing protein n=1 Tax=Crepidotus variabilis TaxID=179855 RepID=A0A9P6E7W4_9AGAR|nr:hypothetical protein CPB83DRAFT_948682 [Crepidotus variabilis]
MVQDNKEMIVRHIVSAGYQLKVVGEALDGWQPNSKDEKRWIDKFTRTLKKQSEELSKLKNESTFRKIVDHEDEQKRIEEIFGNVNTAREQFEASLLGRLKALHIADHKYHLEGKERNKLRRQICTPGTRVRILTSVIVWANSTSPECPSIYWLFGRAGSGKSTIAYTIARRFELAPGPVDTITLGGNFFCSRQFPETKEAKRIVRTIAYHLSLQCKPFADALSWSGKFETINQSVRAQLEGLLVGPWQASESARCQDPSIPAPNYLIVIDALDEIDESGGSDFLRDLLQFVNDNENRLKGLKFFVTSRLDKNLVDHVNSLERQKELYRLEEVPVEEARGDIKTYLTIELDHFKDREEIDKLVTLAGELFIYAATVVKHLAARGRSEQEKFLKMLVNTTHSSDPRLSSDAKAFVLLDTLYSEILARAFHGFDPEEQEWVDRRNILHTLLCTADRTSTSVVTNLLFTSDYTDVADALLNHLHAVLYVEGGKVLWYHKSFPDFIFTKARSRAFWCDEAAHHRLLTTCCFRVMEEGLKFNIGEISSSFTLNNENPALLHNINKHIDEVLRYSCRNWTFHLSATIPTTNEPLLGTLSKFLQLRILFWIEVMNLLKLHGRCEPMLQVVHEWTLNGHSDAVMSVAFSSDDKRILSGSNDKSVRVWDASTGEELKVLDGHSHAVTSVAFSSDGKCIISGSYDQSVQMWDASTGKKLKVLNGHSDWVMSVAFSSDGKCIISGSSDNSVRMWDASTGEVLKVLSGHSGWVMSVAFSSDDKLIISGSNDRSVRMWDASTGKVLKVLYGHSSSIGSIAFSNDGKHIISGSNDGSVRVWDVSTGKELRVLNGHSSAVNTVAFSNHGKHIISGSYDESVRVWDASIGKELNMLDGHTSEVMSVAFSGDGKHIISGSYDQSVRIWDASTGNELRVLNGHSGAVMSVAFSSDDKHIISGSDDKSVRVWDASTGEELKVLNGHSDTVMSVAFLSDDKCIISGSNDGSVQVWDASTGKVLDVLDVLDGHSEVVMSVGFSSNGKQIISGSNDGSVRVWDVSTGKELRVLNGHSGWIMSVAFSSDNKHIISGSVDKSVRVWDASTALQYIREMIWHSDEYGDTQKHTGWLLSPIHQGYLMFVPLTAQLPDAASIMTLPTSAASCVDFTNARLGDQWHECYSPAKDYE